MISIEQAKYRLEQLVNRQKNFYPVVVDGNRHHLNKLIQTKKETITIKKCQQIVKKIKDTFGIEIDKINIMMSEFDYENITPEHYLSSMYGDCGIQQTINKNAYYYPKENRLIIWTDGTPVYENFDGKICKDTDALSDCLM